MNLLRMDRRLAITTTATHESSGAACREVATQGCRPTYPRPLGLA